MDATADKCWSAIDNEAINIPDAIVAALRNHMRACRSYTCAPRTGSQFLTIPVSQKNSLGFQTSAPPPPTARRPVAGELAGANRRRPPGAPHRGEYAVGSCPRSRGSEGSDAADAERAL